MREKPTVQVFLFKNSFKIVMIISLILFGAFYIDLNRKLKQNIQSEFTDSSKKNLMLITSTITSLNNVSKNFLYNSLSSEIIDDYLTNSSPTLTSDQINKIMDALMTIAGPFQEMNQITIFHPSNQLVGVGTFSGTSQYDLFSNRFLKEAFSTDGEAILSNGEKLNYTDKLNNSEEYITLYRPYYVDYKKAGVIGISIKKSRIFEKVNIQNNAVGMAVETKQKDEVFISMGGNSNQEISKIREEKWESSQDYIVEQEIVNNWGIYFFLNNKLAKEPIITFTRNYLMLILLFTVINLFVISFFSRKVSKPIVDVSDEIKAIQLGGGSYSKLKNAKSFDIRELNELKNSFNGLLIRIENYENEIKTVKELEFQARINAMQTQMNPHFLFNILNNIIALAEEEMMHEIVGICHNSANILRYGTTSMENSVKLLEEVKYVEEYIDLMKMRYGSKVSSIITMPSSVLDFDIPKMTLQTFIENIFNYGFNKNYLWNVSLTGILTLDDFKIVIEDDGPGMDKSLLNEYNSLNDLTLIELQKKFNEADSTGILNTYMRLRYFYKDNLKVKFINKRSGGLQLTIVINHRGRGNGRK